MPGSITDTVTLNNGIKMPRFGLGTWQTPEGDVVEASVRWAIEAGYRHIDTAALYKNETGVGNAVRASGVPREEIFVTTKLWTEPLRKGPDAILKAFDESLERLDLGYIDLFLIHWPQAGKNVEGWKAMEKIYASGKAKAIGVSNFLVHHLEELLPTVSVVPAVNQVEFHPLLMQKDVMAYCRKHGIQQESWSPLGQGHLEPIQLLHDIGRRHGKSWVQVIVRWNLQHDIVVIPKSVHQQRIIDNASVFDFELSAEEMKQIDALDCKKRTGGDPDNFPW